jgi:membrane fusion protein, heavy metal efflux system
MLRPKNGPLRFLFLFCALAFISGCSHESKTTSSDTGAHVDVASAQAGFLTVSAGQLSHLKIVPVEKTNWAIAVHTTGTVDWNADLTTPAITQVNGPISRILVEPGQAVQQNQPLLYVNSPDITNAVATYKKALNHLDLTKRILARNTELLNRGAIAQKDQESSEADVNDARTDVENSLQALKIFGISKTDLDAAERQGTGISPQLAVNAPIAGLVVQKLVSPGQLIQAGATTCFIISDISKVWVQGHIFDRDLPSVHVGDAVEETNPSIPTVFHGDVEYIGSMLDAATRTTPVRIVTRNPGGLLKKDMFVEAVIHTRTQRNIIVVPSSAILHDAQNQPFVYVEVQPGKFGQRLVTTGGQQDGQVEIISGLTEGEQIVSDGSLFLQFANSNE